MKKTLLKSNTERLLLVKENTGKERDICEKL